MSALSAIACGQGSQKASESTASVGGSGGSGDTPGLLCENDGGPLVGDLPCDVGTVLENKCQPCHQQPPKNHAHFPLLTYEDTQQPFGIVPDERRWQRMAQVVEPGGQPHMPYGNAPQLTPAELDTLRAWFRACARPAPEGQGCDTGESPAKDAQP